MYRMSKLEDIYYNPDKGLIGPDKLYEKIKKMNLPIKKEEILDFLKNQKTYQLHKRITKQPKLYMPISGLGGTYQMDIMFYSQYKHQNRGWSCILTIINVISRKAYAYKMKGKDETYTNLVTFLKNVDGNVDTLISDNGTEFLNNKVEKLLHDHNILHITADPGDHYKMGMIERFNKTLRGLIERYFTAYNTVRWENVLDKLIDNYNSTEHRSIGMAPNDVTEKDIENIIERNQDRAEAIRDKVASFEVGDKVRIVRRKELFEKGAIPKYSPEVYTIAEISRNGFKLKNESGNIIPSVYKLYQIQKIDEINDPKFEEEKHDRKTIDKTNRVDRRLRKEGVEPALETRQLRSRKPTSQLEDSKYGRINY